MSRNLRASTYLRLAAALLFTLGLGACDAVHEGNHEAATEAHDGGAETHGVAAHAGDAATEAADEAELDDTGMARTDTADADAGETESFGLMNESHPEKGLVFAGQITPEQVQALADAGYETVLDLRGVDEDRGMDEPRVVEAAGLEYVQIPVTGETMDDEATYERFFEALEHGKRPMLVHCGSSNRVGAMYAAYLGSERGVPVEEALAAGREAGMTSPELESRVRARLETAGDG